MKIDNKMLFIVCFGFLLLDCGVPKIAGGDTSETGNSFVAGKVTQPSGEGIPKTQVMLIPAAYNPVLDGPIQDSCIDTTDESGHYIFRIKQQAGKQYNLQAVQILQRTRTLIVGITTGSDTTFVKDAVLKNPGTLQVIFPDTAGISNGYLYIPGTTIFKSLVNAGARVMLDSVPAAILPEICYSTKNATIPTVVRHDVHVTSGDTTVVWNSDWSYSRKITLNTSSSGANVNGSVTNFPTLIRLTVANFDFTQAKSTGDDIRFAKSDTTFLPYEIERWDPVTQVAEVWVKVDTIHGNDSTQSLTLYWGNPNAIGQSDSKVVFDTAAGFAGVWHLGIPAGSTVPDATANGNNGTITATTTVDGAIGMAQMFNGTSSLIRTSGTNMEKLNFSDSGTYSVSAWVKTNVLDSLFHGVVYKSNFEYGLQMRPKNNWEVFTFIDKSRWEMSRSPASDESWHILTGVRNGAKQYLYVDGVCADSSIVTLSTNLALVTDQPLEIGHCPDGGADPDRYFNGAIDEVRISSVAYSVDWIKLSYMNQKLQDELIKW